MSGGGDDCDCTEAVRVGSSRVVVELIEVQGQSETVNCVSGTDLSWYGRVTVRRGTV